MLSTIHFCESGPSRVDIVLSKCPKLLAIGGLNIRQPSMDIANQKGREALEIGEIWHQLFGEVSGMQHACMTVSLSIIKCQSFFGIKNLYGRFCLAKYITHRSRIVHFARVTMNKVRINFS